jgi:hypothetical protein
MQARRLTAGFLTTASILGAALGGLALTSCREEGPAERAGKAIDNAADDAQEAAEDAGDAVKEAFE